MSSARGRGGEVSPPPPEVRGSAVAVARRLAASQRLVQRRLELLPLSGPGSVFSEVQGRQPGGSTTPEDLGELISSIASVGVLQPILAERLPDGSLRLVAGERRLRAARWGAANLPPNPHFEAIPALVCPGPLSEEDRRTWQIAENLVRADLAPGELESGEVARIRPAGPETLPELARWDTFYYTALSAEEEAALDALWGDSYLGKWA